ncbi:L-TYPE LECTIN-DOMAIN CONTAINING RECEPTOR KINASE VII.1 [Salix viminalis]|uniref:L-TYPE LECTIN-DOMAIN CONTAINING RECEPTOR KINASE VII.1 n=1 Tax=Salix viminalis TaxID=40686 RepID=A0A9Q0QI10_SALVM|nr:L-TYPE LECTIN-DOMAIN CONTAINING RECEPTOR KINASE VII.1 [Salix viminalis]
MEDWEQEYWPHRITSQEIEAATKGFSEENVIGIGGNGKVYKGVLPGGTEIAVKRISHENDGMREFLAEISSLGRLKHRSLVGLRGYMAPEIVRSGRASAQTDMFGFGVLILEVMCGRRPIEEGQPPLVEWVWRLMMEGKLLHALDERLKARGDEFEEEEVERILHLGLLCAYPDPKVRPTMRQAVKVLEGRNEASEIEIEDMDTYLLIQMECKDLWTNYSQSSTSGSHPTFDEIRRYQSSSMSLSWTNTTMEDFARQARKKLHQKLAEPRFKSI